MNAHTLKTWFKNKFGIKVRVRTGNSKHPFIGVWIQMSKTSNPNEMKFEQSFPDELGNRLMRIIYKGHPSLEAQNWGGNITKHSLACHAVEWQELLQTYENPALLPV